MSESDQSPSPQSTPEGPEEQGMIPENRLDLIRSYSRRYKVASRKEKGQLLDSFCELTEYNRKYAIGVLRAGPPRAKSKKRAPRPATRRYGAQAVEYLLLVWRHADFPWSVRLKAILALWLPWLEARHPLSDAVRQQLLSMSARTIDRLLRPHRQELKRRRYGRTKPGTLLKHQIEIKTDSWDVTEPGFVEIDCVAHCGNSGEGEFINSVNMTDIHTAWTETRAVIGKGQERVCNAIDEMRMALPFVLKGIDSDNGGEFINHHLFKYCKAQALQFTRGRPYKKNDNAHIEQKNWTHVRRILGWARFESEEALEAINDLYRNEVRSWMNFFQPSVKLIEKKRIGSRLVRKYSPAQTPLDRVLDCPGVSEEVKASLREQRAALDPFQLSEAIEGKLEAIRALVCTTMPKPTGKGKRWHRVAPSPAPDSYTPPSPS
jgi:hypothetical protein